MFHLNNLSYAITIITLVICAACGSHKKPVMQQQLAERQYENKILQQMRVQVEGVECAGCVDDVLAHLKKVPGVQTAAFIGRYDACQQGYFSFYFPATQTFDVQAFNATIAADGFHAKLHR